MTDRRTMLFAVDNSFLTFRTQATFYTHFSAKVLQDLAEVMFNWSSSAHYFTSFLRTSIRCFQSDVCTFLLFTLSTVLWFVCSVARSLWENNKPTDLNFFVKKKSMLSVVLWRQANDILSRIFIIFSLCVKSRPESL